RIEIAEEDVTERIDRLYSKIAWVLDRLYGSPLPFSKLVGDWKRKNVVKNFIPLLQLAHQGKLDIEQEDWFKEIMITKKIQNNQNEEES
ncbi:MAG: hypothetical protein HY515_02475, partial [Candidatus Aenigmarchaeota archaeon]|nr:hypothetical protein [Candidatus Aenigmarchaeota archaeon]